MKSISFVNMKGGVAKTTLAVNVAECMARRHDLSVLLIDIDPQFNATQCLVSGEHYKERCQNGGHTIVHIFEDSPRTVVDTICGTAVVEPVKFEDIRPWDIAEHLHLIPGALELCRVEMGGGQGRENRLRRYVDSLRKESRYDVVIIDSPPTPSAWMASALLASDYYLVPVKPEPLSATGVDLLRGFVERVKDNYSLNIQCAGVVLTMVEEETIVFRDAVIFIDTNRLWKGKRFKYALPKRTKIARLQDEQKLIKDSNDEVIKIALARITEELLQRTGII
jgi:chromosome partitioning protein